MKKPIHSHFVAGIFRVALGYLLGRLLYDLIRRMFRLLGLLVFLGLLGILAAINRG